MIITLWLLLVVAAVAVALAGYLSIETRLARYHIASAQARVFARAGVFLALHRLAADGREGRESSDWLGEAWARSDTGGFSLPGGRVTVQITDEERRLNLRRIREPGLTEVFAALTGGGASLELIAEASEAPLAALEELREIPDITEDLYAIVERHASPWLDPTGTLNLNTADAELLRTVGDVAGLPGLAQRIVAFRWDPEDGGDPAQGGRFVQLRPEVQAAGRVLDPALAEALTALLVGPLGPHLGVQSQGFRLVAEGMTETPTTRCRIEAVVRRASAGAPSSLRVGGETFGMLAWREG